MICYCCHGEKRVLSGHYDAAGGQYIGASMEDCFACGGTGRLDDEPTSAEQKWIVQQRRIREGIALAYARETTERMPHWTPTQNGEKV